jgi:preprotein translocase subunit Sss1
MVQFSLDVSNQESRWKITSLGFVLVGVIGAIFAFIQLEAYLASGLLLLVAVAGVSLLLEMQKAYSIILLIVGILALVFAVIGYLNRGFATLTILYVLLAIVSIVRERQAYQVLE